MGQAITKYVEKPEGTKDILLMVFLKYVAGVQSINGPYVDGLSITIDSNRRHNIYGVGNSGNLNI